MRRAVDRIQAVTRAGLLVVFLAGAPIAALYASHGIYVSGLRTGQAQAAAWHRVPAVVLRAIPIATGWSRSLWSPEPDPQIAAAIEAKYRGKRPRPLAVLIRDQLGEWLGDEDFAAAFGNRGRPGWSPSRLALVTVLQRAENLTDRQAAEAVRTRIDWQYLLGLAWDDPGFDHTVLAEFRARVAGSGLDQVALDALLARLAGAGLVKRRAASSAPARRT